MTRFQYCGRVVSWVKTLQLESERSQFKPHLALSWAFYNFYLAVLQPTLGYSQSESLTYPIFIKKFSTILIWSWPGALSWLSFVTSSLVTFGSKLFQYIDSPWVSFVNHGSAKWQLKKKISDLLCFWRYQTKGLFKILFRQLMM